MLDMGIVAAEGGECLVTRQVRVVVGEKLPSPMEVLRSLFGRVNGKRLWLVICLPEDLRMLKMTLMVIYD
jgi:hypothetical protein